MAFTRIRLWLRSFFKAEDTREGRERVRRVRPMLEELESRLTPAAGTSSTLALADAPLMADDALVDLLNPTPNAANGTKTSLHHAGPPASNGINLNPPNYAGVGQGPSAPSTPFATGGSSSSGGGGGGPIGGNLATLGNQGLFSNPAVTTAATQSAAIQQTPGVHIAPATSLAPSQVVPAITSGGTTAREANRVLTPSDDPTGSGTFSGNLAGNITSPHPGVQLIQLGFNNVNISGGLIGGFSLTGEATYNGGSGSFNEAGGGDIGTTSDNETGFGGGGPLRYSVSGSTISGTLFFNGTTTDGSGRIVSGEGTFSGTIDGNGNINGALNGNINLAPPPLVVTQATDNGTGQTQGSLSWAITQANLPANKGSTITFNIPNTSTIQVTGELPTITKPVTIDGYSQAGQNATPGTPAVEVRGGAANQQQFGGLTVDSGQVVIEGLAIDGFAGTGITLNDLNVAPGDGDTVQGCYIGTDLTGENPNVGNSDGISITGANNTIGGSGIGAGNVISGNAGLVGNGISIQGSDAVANVVEENLIGVDASGLTMLPNKNNGVDIEGGADNNTIGGPSSVGNVISGNGANGVYIRAASNNVVYGNDIGVAGNGSTVLGNTVNGVLLENNASSTVIGSTIGGRGNVISGNGGDGILLDNPISQGVNDDNTINGNSIGVTSDGESADENGQNGIEIKDIVGTFVTNNVLSGNGVNGLAFEGPDAITGSSYAAQTTVTGNKIGTNATGTAAVRNKTDGIYIYLADQNTIGGETSPPAGTEYQASNIISGNGVYGIEIDGSSSNLVENNYIGTDVTGLRSIYNTDAGILFGVGKDSGNNNVHSANNIIGGTAGIVNDTINVISGNGDPTKSINQGFGIIMTSGATENGIEGNRIGVGVDGVTALGNTNTGVYLQAGTGDGNTIGGTEAGNIISGNGTTAQAGSGWGYGVDVASDDTSIVDNTIGLDINGNVLANTAGWMQDVGNNNNWINNQHN